jgi:AraC-like DNA-binding protein
MIIIPPAVPYKLLFKNNKGAEYYLLNFDFVFDAQKRKAIAPAEEEFFDEKQIFSFEHPQDFDHIFIVNEFAEAKPLLDKMCEEKGLEIGFRDQLWSALLKQILVRAQIIKKSGESKQSENKLVLAIKKWVKENVTNAPTNVAVARFFGYHPNYLNNLFSNQTGNTLYNYIMTQRVLAAKERLARGKQSITEISQELGFCDTSYFSAFFKRQTGISPKQYRDRIR